MQELTVTHLGGEIELALVSGGIIVRTRFVGAPRHRGSANASSGRQRVPLLSGGTIRHQVATRFGHYGSVRTMPSPSARDL